MNFPKLFLTLPVLCMICFTECKKGPDDPFISLRSREGRVTGDWKMASATESHIISDGDQSNSEDITVYDGSAYTTITKNTVASVTNEYVESGSYALKLVFKKNGSFELEQTRDGDLMIAKGTWNFTGKVGSVKNKEQIVLHITSESGPGSNYTSTYTGNTVDITFNIKELRNKKMVLVTESGTVDQYAYPYNGNTSTDIYKSKSEYVLEQ